MSEDREQFSVYQEYSTGFGEYVRRLVSAQEAVRAFHQYTHAISARSGAIVRVLITDGGDRVVREWRDGVTLP